VQNQPQVTFKPNADALPDPSNCTYLFARNTADWRQYCAQQKRAHNANLFQSLPENAFLQRFDVDNDVGKLGHGFQNTARFK